MNIDRFTGLRASAILLLAFIATAFSANVAGAQPCFVDPDDENCGLVANTAGGCPAVVGPLFVSNASCMVSTRTLRVEAWSCAAGYCTTPSSVVVYGSTTQGGSYTLIGSLTQSSSCVAGGDLWIGEFCFDATHVKPSWIKVFAADGCGIEDLYAQYCCSCDD